MHKNHFPISMMRRNIWTSGKLFSLMWIFPFASVRREWRMWVKEKRKLEVKKPHLQHKKNVISTFICCFVNKMLSLCLRLKLTQKVVCLCMCMERREKWKLCAILTEFILEVWEEFPCTLSINLFCWYFLKRTIYDFSLLSFSSYVTQKQYFSMLQHKFDILLLRCDDRFPNVKKTVDECWN